MDKEHFLKSGLLEQYVLGLTTPEETATVEHYIQTFPDIREKVTALKKEIDEYTRQSLPNIPPAVIHQPIASVRLPAWAIWAGAALIATCVFFASEWYKADARIMANEQALQDCQAEHAICVQTAQMLAFLEHEDTRPVYLNGTPLLPEAKALVYWNHTAKSAYFNPIRLPEAPAGHQYQIWADVEGIMINMGLIEPDKLHLQALRYIPEAESLNITIEPKGGSDHPTVSQLCLNGDFLAAK
ncbi:MAG: anti-sigma factor [Saprospiraceae bacterium]|nr:anti-sigma factor [Saprospiraceae bacterium]